MEINAQFTAFDGDRLLCGGTAAAVALAVKAAGGNAGAGSGTGMVLAFNDLTGQQVDFDLRGSDAEIAARLAPAGVASDEARRPGRPKLGVIAREVTLLPRHWDWLAGQPGGASVTLRKLVDAARSSGEGRQAARAAQQAADRIMSAMLGDQPGYEEASRALYAGDRDKFLRLTEAWPAAPRDYVRRVAAPGLPTAG